MIKIKDKSYVVRQALKLSQTELAKMIGSSDFKLINRIETGKVTQPLGYYADKIDDLYKKVVKFKDRIIDNEYMLCDNCAIKISLIGAMLDGGKIHCKGCYHSLRGE